MMYTSDSHVFLILPGTSYWASTLCSRLYSRFLTACGVVANVLPTIKLHTQTRPSRRTPGAPKRSESCLTLEPSWETVGRRSPSCCQEGRITKSRTTGTHARTHATHRNASQRIAMHALFLAFAFSKIGYNRLRTQTHKKEACAYTRGMGSTTTDATNIR